MLEPRRVDIINAQIGPIECRLNCFHCLRLIHFVDLRHIKDGLGAVDLFEIMHDFQDWWFGAVEVQARVRPERVSPRRCEKDDDKMIARVPPRSHEVLVTAVDEFDRRLKLRDVAGRQIEDGGLDFKTNTPGARQMPQNRVEAVA